MTKRKEPYNKIGGKSPIRKFMKKSGAGIVDPKAVDKLATFIANENERCTEQALKFAKHSNRKKIKQTDIQLAIDMKCNR